MSIKISIKNNINPNSIKNYVFFTNKDFRINGYSKLPISKYSNFINKLLNSSELGNKNFLSGNLCIYLRLLNKFESLDHK